jgi:hypothetical protein
MPKPRYEEEEDVSRHSAADEGCCEEMEEKYGWELVAIEEINDPFFGVDCVFDGETEFPKPYNETEKEEDEDA